MTSVKRAEVGEQVGLGKKAAGDLLVRAKGEADVGIRLGNHGQNLIALGGLERLGHAAGNNPAGMNALFAKQLNDVLAKAAQANAGAAQLRFGRDNAEDIAGSGIGLHAEKKIRRREVEKAQRVRLHHLGQVEHAPQLRGGVRNADRHDGFAGFGRCNQMRHRADAADARHQAGHLIKRSALGELLKAAHLRYMEVRVFHLALSVELDGDFAVAFKACDGIDGDGLAHKLRLQNG